MDCPRCGRPVPVNEATAYHGRHEDCSSISNLPPAVFQPSKGVIIPTTPGAYLGQHRKSNRSSRRS